MLHQSKIISVTLAILLTMSSANLFALSWPVWPDSTHRPISAIYATYQEGMGLHSGIDIAVPAGTPLYAMESGYVKAIITLYGSYSSWRIVIGDSAGTEECEAWMYAHITPSYIAFSVGDWVNAGDSLSTIVSWPGNPETVQHLHLSRIKYWGDSANWANHFFDEWEFIANPLDFFDNVNINDTTAPFFENAWAEPWGNQLFAFSKNEAIDYFDEGEPLSGEIDIICSAYDYHDFYVWKDSPYMLEYKIEGDSSIQWTTSFILNETIGNYPNVAIYYSIIYQDDYYCNTQFTVLNGEAYFFNITNTNGDGHVEPSDKLECWQTPFFHNGEYTVFARATDYTGHSTIDSMIITVENFFELSGTVSLDEGKTGLEGVIVTVPRNGARDITDELGYYSIPDVGGGTQLIEIRKGGYSSLDTTLMMNENRQLDASLTFNYFCGDANNSGTVNILDITYLISFLYKDGPDPIPMEAGDANGNGTVNILDITHLIGFLYQDGPEPACP